MFLNYIHNSRAGSCIKLRLPDLIRLPDGVCNPVRNICVPPCRVMHQAKIAGPKIAGRGLQPRPKYLLPGTDKTLRTADYGLIKTVSYNISLMPLSAQ